MINIDGAQGEGGGQIVRSSLALSIVTQRPVTIENIRAGRKKPGLLRQHLTCLEAATWISNACASGGELGSSKLVFEPNPVTPGTYDFQIGSAGSTSLVLQTILPALMLADSSSEVTVTGGTHNPAAPPFDFLTQAYAPQVAKMGPKIAGTLEAYGFFPAGGGKIRFEIEPSSSLRGLELLARGGDTNPSVTAIVSDLNRTIAERECDTIRRKTNWRSDCFHIVEVEQPRGPGNVVMIELAAPNVTEVFIAFGKQGVKAEQVARGALREARRHLASAAPVGQYLADQLLLPMGLAASQGQASQFLTTSLSQHSKTHIDVLHAFLDIDINVQENEEGTFLVTVKDRASE